MPVCSEVPPSAWAISLAPAYEQLLEVAVAGVESRCVNSDNKPVVVVVVLDPFNGAALLGALRLQQKAQAATGGDAMDLRVLAFPSDPQESKRLQDQVHGEVKAAWYNQTLKINGFPRMEVLPFPEVAAKLPTFQICELTSTGHLTVPTQAFKDLLAADAFRGPAEDLLSAFQARMQAPGSKFLKVPSAKPAKKVVNLPAREVIAAVAFPAALTKDELLSQAKIVDTHTKDAKIRVMVLQDGSAYGLVVATHEVTQGSLFLGCGSCGEAGVRGLGGLVSCAESGGCARQSPTNPDRNVGMCIPQVATIAPMHTFPSVALISASPGW